MTPLHIHVLNGLSIGLCRSTNAGQIWYKIDGTAITTPTYISALKAAPGKRAFEHPSHAVILKVQTFKAIRLGARKEVTSLTDVTRFSWETT